MNTVSDRINQIIREKNINKTKLAEIAGVTNQAVTYWGKRNQISIEAATKICKELNLSLDWLLAGNENFNLSKDLIELKNDDSGVKINVLDVQASCGSGLIVDNEFTSVLRSIEFTQDFALKLFGKRSADFIKVITAKGDSMIPTIKSGANIFVDTKINYFDGDGVYVFVFDNEIYIKRIQITGTEIVIISDNPLYEKWRLSKNLINDLYIQGKVFIGQNIEYVYFD